MIQIGPIETNNKISAKVYLFLSIFSIILLIILLNTIISNIIKLQHYDKVESTILDKYSKIKYINKKYVRRKYVKLNYEYNSKSYTIEKEIFFSFNKKIGNTLKIYVNPELPLETFDTINMTFTCVSAIIFLFSTFVFIKGYIIQCKKK